MRRGFSIADTCGGADLWMDFICGCLIFHALADLGRWHLGQWREFGSPVVRMRCNRTALQHSEGGGAGENRWRWSSMGSCGAQSIHHGSPPLKSSRGEGGRRSQVDSEVAGGEGA